MAAGLKVSESAPACWKPQYRLARPLFGARKLPAFDWFRILVPSGNANQDCIALTRCRWRPGIEAIGRRWFARHRLWSRRPFAPRLFASEKVRPPILFIVSKLFFRFGQLAHQTNLPKGRPPERVPVPATTCDQQPRRWKSHFANGSRRFANGSRRFTNGSRRFTNGSSRFTNGSSRFTNGSSRFTNGSSRFANGSSRFSGGKVTLQMGAVIFPAEKSLCKWEQSFFRRKSRFANLQTTTQTCKTIFPTEKSFYKWEQSFFRRRNRFANWSSHFSGGEIALQIGAVIFPAEKSPGKFAK